MGEPVATILFYILLAATFLGLLIINVGFWRWVFEKLHEHNDDDNDDGEDEENKIV
jgi:hypothetical protein